MNRDSRAAVLAALREVYDGSYTRCVGTDGGKVLCWSGKVGLVAACTPTIDRHHAVMATMGERFILYRLPPLDPDAVVRKALARGGQEVRMRRELGEAVRGLFASLDLSDEATALSDRETTQLVALAAFVAQCRAPVERDGYKRHIELIPGPEAPTRIALTLVQFLRGLRAIGCDQSNAWRIIKKTALDCLPDVRRRVIESLADGEERKTREVAEALDYPTTTARRTLEDLAVYGVVRRRQASDGDRWYETEWAKQTRLAAFRAIPEMSGDQESGVVPETSGEKQGNGSSLSLLPLHVFGDFSGTVADGGETR